MWMFLLEGSLSLFHSHSRKCENNCQTITNLGMLAHASNFNLFSVCYTIQNVLRDKMTCERRNFLARWSKQFTPNYGEEDVATIWVIIVKTKSTHTFIHTQEFHFHRKSYTTVSAILFYGTIFMCSNNKIYIEMGKMYEMVFFLERLSY